MMFTTICNTKATEVSKQKRLPEFDSIHRQVSLASYKWKVLLVWSTDSLMREIVSLRSCRPGP